MDLTVAHKLATSLMTKHGLDAKLFDFDNSVKRFGVCKYSFRRIGGLKQYTFTGISLSKNLVKLNNEERVTDVILHEIAHALTPGDGHGHAWKRKCVEIGCRPIRCYSSNDTETPTLRYKAECGGCGKIHQKVRIPKHNGNMSCNCQSGISWDTRHRLNFK